MKILFWSILYTVKRWKLIYHLQILCNVLMSYNKLFHIWNIKNNIKRTSNHLSYIFSCSEDILPSNVNCIQLYLTDKNNNKKLQTTYLINIPSQQVLLTNDCFVELTQKYTSCDKTRDKVKFIFFYINYQIIITQWQLKTLMQSFL